jgi:xylan 1,4-beta-xylosidase
MGISKETEDVQRGFEIVSAFPRLKNLPIILSEADPEGCAACSSRVYPQNAYRNGSLYPTYTALMLKNIFDLADRHQTNIAGMLTWAFEFEDQPYFDGFRTLATNGVDKPVLNVFRMAALMAGQRVSVESSHRIPLETIASQGVRGITDVDALATRSLHHAAVLVWNYQDEDIPGVPAQVQLKIAGLPKEASRVLIRHYRIDQTHSNSYTLWKQQGEPAQPDPTQYAELESAGSLDLLDSPRWIDAHAASVDIHFSLPLQATSLIELTWQ